MSNSAPPQAPETLGARAVYVALAELAEGVREQPLGSHAGPRIATYFAPCVRAISLPGGVVQESPLGISSGDWCAAFASYCAQHAAADDEAIPHLYRASVHELWTDAVASTTSRSPSYRPRRGDLAIYARDGSNPTQGGLGHVGRVSAELDDQGQYETIEGNHGGAVARVKHTFGDTVGWIAYP
jgi:CHAP domain